MVPQVSSKPSPIPCDYEQARIEAIMEEYGWPIEDDDSHPEMASYRKRQREQEELDRLYMDEMERLDQELADTIDETYGDEEHEAAARSVPRSLRAL